MKLNDSLNAAAGDFKKLRGKEVNSFIPADKIVDNLNRALALYEKNSVFTLGQNRVFPGANVCNAVPANTSANAALPAPCVSPKLVSPSQAVPFVQPKPA